MEEEEKEKRGFDLENLLVRSHSSFIEGSSPVLTESRIFSKIDVGYSLEDNNLATEAGRSTNS